MQTLLITTLHNEALELKEGYQTIKKRLFDGNTYIEVTDKAGNKLLYNKHCVAALTAVAGKVEKVVSVKKTKKK